MPKLFDVTYHCDDNNNNCVVTHLQLKVMLVEILRKEINHDTDGNSRKDDEGKGDNTNNFEVRTLPLGLYLCSVLYIYLSIYVFYIDIPRVVFAIV